VLIHAVWEVDRTLTGGFGAFAPTLMALALEKAGLRCGSLPLVEVSGSNTGQNIDRLSWFTWYFPPKAATISARLIHTRQTLKNKKNVPCLFLSAPVYTNGQAHVTGHSRERECTSEEHLNKKQHVNRLVFAVQISEPCSK